MVLCLSLSDHSLSLREVRPGRGCGSFVDIVRSQSVAEGTQGRNSSRNSKQKPQRKDDGCLIRHLTLS